MRIEQIIDLFHWAENGEHIDERSREATIGQVGGSLVDNTGACPVRSRRYIPIYIVNRYLVRTGPLLLL